MQGIIMDIARLIDGQWAEIVVKLGILGMFIGLGLMIPGAIKINNPFKRR